MDESEVKCPLCTSTFTKKKNLYTHLRTIHKVEPFNRKKKLEFECKDCDKSFSHKASLTRHIRTFHVTNEYNQRENRKVRLICPYKTCSEEFLHYDNLRKHLSAEHCIEVESEDLTFDSNEDFEDWKQEVEQISNSWYTQDSGIKLLKNGAIRLYLNCHRSYCYKPKGRNIRATKSSGSNKIGKACPSRLEVTKKQNSNRTTVYVKYWKTHHGHLIERQHYSKRCIRRYNRKEFKTDIKEDSGSAEEKILNQENAVNKCSVCNKIYSKKKYLYTHLLNVHEIDPLNEKANGKFLCDTCGKNFLFKSSLTLHGQLHHGVKNEKDDEVEDEYRLSQNEDRKEILTCPNEKCNKQFSSYENLNKHLFDKHCVVVQYEDLTFDSCQGFEDWKYEMEENTGSWYTKDSELLKSGAHTIYLNCHHSESYEPKGKIIRGLKSNEYINIGKVCPSRLEVTMEENSKEKLSVKFWKTHYHTQKLDEKENFKRSTPGFKEEKLLTETLDPVKLYSVSVEEKLLTKNNCLIKCSICDKFMKKKRLYTHLINFHQIGPLQQKASEKFLCDTCGKSFLFKPSLILHTQLHHGKTVHEDENNLSENEDGRMSLTCPHEACNEQLYNYESLDKHLKEEHCVEVQCEELTFNSSDDFVNWRYEMDENTDSWYTKDSEMKLHQTGATRLYLNCSYFYDYGTNKIVKACPSRLEVTLEENKISVKFWKTHYGHRKKIKREENSKRILHSKSPTPKITRVNEESPPDLLDSEMLCSMEKLMNTDDSIIIFSVSDDKLTKEKNIYLHSVQETKELQQKSNLKFLCDQCGENFTCKFTLIQHILKTHSPKNEFTKEKNLNLPNIAESKQLQQKSNSKFLCDECGQIFICKSTLISHILKTHRSLMNELEHIGQSEERKVRVICPLRTCNKLLLSYEILRKHLSFKHGVESQCEDLTFDSSEDFENWKQEMQESTKSLYTKDSEIKLQSGGHKLYFNCNRSCCIKLKGKIIRALKSNKTKKLGKTCPSRLEVTITESSNSKPAVSVKYWKTHCGHTRKMKWKRNCERLKRRIRKKRQELYVQISDSEMLRSVIPVEKLISTDKSIIKCSVCDGKFSKKKNLYTHLRSIHKIEPLLQNERAQFHCNICAKRFLFKSSLVRHARIFHQVFQNVDRTMRLICPQEACNEEFLSYKKLRDHLFHAHCFVVQCKDLIFNSNEDFLTWKHEMEKNTKSLYTKDSGIIRLKSGEKRMYLNCHRSYYYKPRCRNLRALKSSGSNKIGKACPSRLEVSIKESSYKKSIVSVKYWETHCGHAQEIIRKKKKKPVSHLIQGEQEK